MQTALSEELLTELHQNNVQVIEKKASSSRTRATLLQVFAYLEANPIIEIRKTAQALAMAYNTAASAVRLLLEVGILAQTIEQNRNRTFAYQAYLKILRKGTE